MIAINVRHCTRNRIVTHHCRGRFLCVTVVTIINAIGQGRFFTLGQRLCCNYQLGNILGAAVISLFRKGFGQIRQHILGQSDNRHQGRGNGYSFFNQSVKQMLDRPGYAGDLICTHHAPTPLEGMEGPAHLNHRLLCVG